MLSKNTEWRTLLARSWEEYGLFSLRSGQQQQQQQPQHSAPATTTVVTTIKDNNIGTTVSSSSGGNNGGSNTLDHAARCLEESLRVYPPGSDGSLAAASVLTAVSMEQGQLDRAWALLEAVLEQRLPALEEGADGLVTVKTGKNNVFLFFIQRGEKVCLFFSRERFIHPRLQKWWFLLVKQ